MFFKEAVKIPDIPGKIIRSVDDARERGVRPIAMGEANRS